MAGNSNVGRPFPDSGSGFSTPTLQIRRELHPLDPHRTGVVPTRPAPPPPALRAGNEPRCCDHAATADMLSSVLGKQEQANKELRARCDKVEAESAQDKQHIARMHGHFAGLTRATWADFGEFERHLQRVYDDEWEYFESTHRKSLEKDQRIQELERENAALRQRLAATPGVPPEASERWGPS